MAQKTYDSNSQRYMTPSQLYQPILDYEEIEKFDMDVACENKNIPAKKYYTENGLYKDDFFFQLSPETGLTGEWEGICFMNCPWNLSKLFIPKAVKAAEKGCKVWAILPADRFETKYFQENLLQNPDCFLYFLSQKQGFLVPESPIEQPKPSVKVVMAYFGNDAQDRWVDFAYNFRGVEGTVCYNALNLPKNKLNCKEM